MDGYKTDGYYSPAEGSARDQDGDYMSQSSDHQQASEGSGGPKTGSLSSEDFKAQKERTLEVCRGFIQGRCRHSEFECRYAHPAPYVQVNDGRVTCCFDYSRGRCNRVNPPCRYLHPPPHLMPEGASKAQPLSMHSMYMGMLPPYLASAIAAYTSGARQPMPRGMGGLRVDRRLDKVEVCREFKGGKCQREECRYAHPPPDARVDYDGCVTACMDFVNGQCIREKCRYFHPPHNITQRLLSVAGKGGGGARKRQHSSDYSAEREGTAASDQSNVAESTGGNDDRDAKYARNSDSF